MAWLDGARKMVQSWAPAPPAAVQRYSVACREGHRLRGERTAGYQALRCPTCGEGIFVLPRSPLPEPPAPAARAGASASAAYGPGGSEDDPIALTDPPAGSDSAIAAAGDDEAVEAEVQWVDEDQPPARPPGRFDPVEAALAEAKARPPKGPAAAPSPQPASPPAPRAAPKSARTRAAAPSPARQALEPPARVESWGEWARRRRNALVAAAVVLALGGTVQMRRLRQWREELPRRAEEGRTLGLEALDAGRFAEAKELLGRAREAVEAMGGQYDGAAAIVQGAREAALFTDLAPERLEEVLDQGLRAESADAWAKQFDALYRGRSILVQDAEVVKAPDAAGAARGPFEVDYLVIAGRGPKPAAVGRLDLEGFTLFAQAGTKAGAIVTFGARLASMRRDPASGRWLFALEPDSGVFMTHAPALASIGLGPGDEAGP